MKLTMNDGSSVEVDDSQVVSSRLEDFYEPLTIPIEIHAADGHFIKLSPTRRELDALVDFLRRYT